jgi:hypothetical protein
VAFCASSNDKNPTLLVDLLKLDTTKNDAPNTANNTARIETNRARGRIDLGAAELDDGDDCLSLTYTTVPISSS